MAIGLAERQSILRMTSVVLTTIGTLIISFALLHLHAVIAFHWSIDKPVVTALHYTRSLSIVGIVILSFAAVIAVAAEILIFTEENPPSI